MGVEKIGASYRGEWTEQEQKFKGVLTQRGMSMPLDFSKNNERNIPALESVSKIKRPQTPPPSF